MTDSNGTRVRAASNITVQGALGAAAGLMAHPGRTTVTLRWAAGGPNAHGYRVHRADTEGGAATPLTAAPLVEPIFVDETPPGGGAWYSVALVDGSGSDGPRSAEVHAVVDPTASQAAPLAPVGFAAVPTDLGFALSFEDDLYHTLGWLLERAEAEGGSYTPVLPAGALLAGSGFREGGLAAGAAVHYRLTPLGRDLIAGPASLIGPLAVHQVCPRDFSAIFLFDRPQ